MRLQENRITLIKKVIDLNDKIRTILTKKYIQYIKFDKGAIPLEKGEHFGTNKKQS